jgi:hypothetical protein
LVIEQWIAYQASYHRSKKAHALGSR